MLEKVDERVHVDVCIEHGAAMLFGTIYGTRWDSFLSAPVGVKRFFCLENPDAKSFGITILRLSEAVAFQNQDL